MDFFWVLDWGGSHSIWPFLYIRRLL